MTGLGDMVTASVMAAAVDMIRFDRTIESFKFTPSLGIVSKRLGELAEELKDMREPLTKSVEDVMTISILENFMSGGRPPWEDLSPVTVKRRAKENSGDMILVRSGSLAEVASSAKIWSIGSTTATIRDLPQKVWYGKVHQSGLEGNNSGGGDWFKKYQAAAKQQLGPEASQKEVDNEAYKIFDRRQARHGPAPTAVAPIPARPFAMFQDEDIDAIENIFVDWIEEKVQEAGLR